MKLKKLFNILLVALLCIGIFTFNSEKVFAEESGTYDNVDWRITDSGELIIGKEGETQTFTYRGDRYLNSYPWYSKWNSISSVHFAGVVNGNGSHRGMFYNFQVTSLDLTSFNTSNVTNMNSMFEYCQATSLNLSNFDTSKVTGMQNMFRKSQATSLNLSSFNTSKVTNMNLMFAESQATSINLNSFNTSNVTDMGSMFENSKAASLDLSSFNTSKVTSMQKMFRKSQATSIVLSSFNTSKVTDMSLMFDESKAASLDLSSFDTSSVTNMYEMFHYSQAASLDLSSFNTANVTNMAGMFCGSKATSINLSSFNTSNVRDMSDMFRNSQATSLNLSSFNTSNVTDMSSMFYNSQAASISLNSFNTSNVTDMSGMFSNSRATSLDLNSFNTSNVTDMGSMFSYSQATSLNLNSFNTSNVTDMHWMFAYPQATSLDLSSFDTSSVTNMQGMFRGSKVTSLDLSNFNTSNVTSMSGMFAGAQTTSLDLSSFDTSNVTDTSLMFSYSQTTSLDLSSFNTSNVTNMNYMFSGFQATHIRFSNNMLGDNGERFKNTRLSGSDWVKVRDKSGNLTYNDTQFSGEQVCNLNESTTPALSGTWVKKSSPEYQSEIDKGQEYISKQGINANNEWVKNGNTWTYTFDVFDDSIPYYIWEDIIPGYSSSVMKPNKGYFNENAEKYYEITNRSTDTGSIKISKQTNDTSDKRFEFTIRLTGSNLDGTKIFSGVIFEDGVGKVILGKGESKTIEGLPIGTSYTVEEKEYADYIVTSSNTSGIITKGNTSEVTFNNDLIPPKPEGMHSLSIKKSIIGSSDRETPYEFMIYFDNLGENKTILTSRDESLAASDNGSLYHKFELKGDETLSFIDVPLGATYQITESAGEYISSYEIKDINQTNQIVNTSNENTSSNTALSTQVETVDEGESIMVNFSNRIIKKQDIKIKKEVIGTNEDKNKNFDITIELYGLNPRQGIETDLGKITADEDGYAIKTIQLKHGEEFIIPELPIGTQYQITEPKNNCFSSYTLINDGKKYIVEKQSDSNKLTNQNLSTRLETVDEDEQITVLFTNKSALSLTLEKIVDGNMGNKTDEFTFTVKVNNPESMVSDYKTAFIVRTPDQLIGGNEVARIECLSEEPLIFNGENCSNTDSWTFIYEDLASIDSIPSSWRPFFNDYSGNQIVQQNGIYHEGPLYMTDMTITVGDNTYTLIAEPHQPQTYNGITNYNYAFHYDISKGDANNTFIDLSEYGGTENGDGTYSFKLSHGDKIEFSNIPYGAEFEIIENDYSSLGYRTYINNSLFQKRQISDTLFADKDVIFSNINGAAVPTEIRLYGSGALLIAISTLLFIYLKKKKRVMD